MVWRRACVCLCLLGCGDASSAVETDATQDSANDATAAETGAPMGSCPAPDPTLAPVPEGQAASTQAAYACMAAVACLCDVRSHDTVPSCRHGLNMSFERIQADAQAMGLSYDGACLAQHVADLAAIGCAVDPATSPSGAPWSVIGPGRCGVYHGTGSVGDACTAIAGGLSDCAQGLACWSGRCTDPCPTSTPGERCQGVFGFACPPGTVCESDDCVAPQPPAQIGEDCDGIGCIEGAWCSELCGFEVCESTCVAQTIDGAPCEQDRQCTSGFCGGGACTTGPVTGEACVADRCFAGRECVDGICGEPEAAICPPA